MSSTKLLDVYLLVVISFVLSQRKDEYVLSRDGTETGCSQQTDCEGKKESDGMGQGGEEQRNVRSAFPPSPPGTARPDDSSCFPSAKERDSSRDRRPWRERLPDVLLPFTG
ncbi:hypothetical protein CgunFtcFv8_000198 [Champsocephalus gunnari]|uniref:Uncharacterized protein n=1 Tax=Champsocephalus gunnari TaxID=52237 RepID=A0AAN8DI10_CHAGU|nr:hypothetical protein CgunFtcFv8_000198 [Champsocephalus gunnari]